jgi:aquaporin Z
MVKKLSAEFIGTLWLVLGGCGSAVLAAAFPNVGIGLLGVSLKVRVNPRRELRSS